VSRMLSADLLSGQLLKGLLHPLRQRALHSASSSLRPRWANVLSGTITTHILFSVRRKCSDSGAATVQGTVPLHSSQPLCLRMVSRSGLVVVSPFPLYVPAANTFVLHQPLQPYTHASTILGERSPQVR
jgi:hypothetical protein